MLALLASAIIGFGWVQPGFMPESARPQFVVDMYLPQGSDIKETAAELAKMSEYVQGREGVTHVSSFVGQGGLALYADLQPRRS